MIKFILTDENTGRKFIVVETNLVEALKHLPPDVNPDDLIVEQINNALPIKGLWFDIQPRENA